MAETTNQRVVIWARGHVGKKIGRGECWDLADQALTHSGAASSAALGPMGDDADYVWGDAVNLHDVIAGDILQLRDVVVTTRVDTEVTFTDGSGGSTSFREKNLSHEHHTAIVDAVLGGGMLRILEQNSPPLGKRVQRQTFPTQSSVSAPKTSFRNIKPERGKARPARVVETTSVSVTGTIRAYRPRKK